MFCIKYIYLSRSVSTHVLHQIHLSNREYLCILMQPGCGRAGPPQNEAEIVQHGDLRLDDADYGWAGMLHKTPRLVGEMMMEGRREGGREGGLHHLKQHTRPHNLQHYFCMRRAHSRHACASKDIFDLHALALYALRTRAYPSSSPTRVRVYACVCDQHRLKTEKKK